MTATILRLAVSASLALAAFGATGAHATETCQNVTAGSDAWWTVCADPAGHDGAPCIRFGGQVVVYHQPSFPVCVV